MQTVLHFGGVARTFDLRFGDLADIERACDAGIGAVYLRLASVSFWMKDVKAILVAGLTRGGMDRAEAERLVVDIAENGGLLECQAAALDLLVATMSGAQTDGAGDGADPDEPMDLGKIFAGFAALGIGPDQVRSWDYADFVNMVRAMGGDKLAPPSVEEFEAMRAKYEGVVLT